MKSQDCGQKSQKKEEKVRKSEVRKKVEVKKRHSSHPHRTKIRKTNFECIVGRIRFFDQILTTKKKKKVALNLPSVL